MKAATKAAEVDIAEISAPDLATSRTMQGEIRKRFQAMAPLVDFLNAPLAEARPKKTPRVLL